MPASRRSVMLSLPPLWLIGVCLFLPMVRACEKTSSPASLLWGWPWGAQPFLFLGLLAPFLVAQLLVILAVVAVARGHVSRLVTRATALLVVSSGASAALLSVILLKEHTVVEQALSVFAAGSIVAAVAVLMRACSYEPWARLLHFHAAYTIFMLPLASLVARCLVRDGVHQVGVGVFVFLAAVAALVAVHARTLARARAPVARVVDLSTAHER